MEAILGSVIYSVLGFVLMQLGVFLVDLVIPCNFPEEIKKENQAVGYIMAGSYITTGLLVRSVIASPVAMSTSSLGVDVLNTVFYFGVGMALCIVGYVCLALTNKKYHLNEEIGRGNTAAGIMIAGMFIGLGILISGAIQ
ncbi:MAG: DUF350 domain-containing protein [Cellulosilyticaceae bacterium]